MEPAKLSTLGHVQVFAEDAAADEGGEISFIAPQNNYRLIPEPQKVIDTVLREEPRLSAGIARLMVGALALVGRRVDGGPAHRHRPAGPRRGLSRPRPARGPLLRARGEGHPAQPRRRAEAWGGGGRDGGRPRHHGRRAPVRRQAHRDRRLEGGRPRRLRVGLVLRRPRRDPGAPRRGRRGRRPRLPATRRRPSVRAGGRVGDGGAAPARDPGACVDLGGDGRALPRRDDRHPLRGRDPARGARHHRRRRGPQHRPHVGLRADAGDRDDPGGGLPALPRGGALPARGPLPRGGRARRRRAPRRRARALVLGPRHPGLQRGAALLLRRGLPLHDSRLARPRLRPGADDRRLRPRVARAPRSWPRACGPPKRCGTSSHDPAAPRHGLPEPAPREAPQRARRGLDGARHRRARARLRARRRDHPPALGQPRRDPDRAPAGGGPARRLRGAEQPLRRLRPGPPARRRALARRIEEEGRKARRRARRAVPLPARHGGGRQSARAWRGSWGSLPREPELRAAHAGGVGDLPARGRSPRRLRGRARGPQAPRRRRGRGVLRRPDPAGGRQQPGRHRVRDLPQGGALVRQRLLRDPRRRAGARGLAGRGHEREGAPRGRACPPPRPGGGGGSVAAARPGPLREGDAGPRRELHRGRPLLLGDHPGQRGRARHALRASSSPRPGSGW